MAHLGTTYQYCEALSAHAKAQRQMASFPLSQRPFGRLNLSETERRRFHTQATELLGSALQEYEEFALIRHHQVDRRRWKPIKTHEQLTIYRESRSYVVGHSLSMKDDSDSSARQPRLSSSSGGSASGSMSLPAHQVTELELLTGWGPTATEARELKRRAKNVNGTGKSDRLPTLLGVGTIIGSLDDVMYGVAASDCASMALKQAYSHEDVLDGDVLAAIEGPTQRSPFRFLGIKWLVKSIVGSNAKHKGISPRDLVYLEATGVITRDDGARIGYQILHSVKLRNCPDLKDSHGVIRAQCESAHLFVELNNKTVDVFLKSHVTPNGTISESGALQSFANSLLSCSKTMEFSQDKKLMWQLECTMKRGRDHDKKVTASHCSVCNKSFGLLRPSFKCKLCSSAMCSKCCIERTLKRVDASGDSRHTNKVVSKVLVELCTSCVATNLKTSALTLAREEVMSGRFGRKSSGQGRDSDHSADYSSSIATISIEDIPGQREYIARPPRRSEGSTRKCYQSQSRENRRSHREQVKSRDDFDVGDNTRRHQSPYAYPDVSTSKRSQRYGESPPTHRSKHCEQPRGRPRAGSDQLMNPNAYVSPLTIRRGQSGGLHHKMGEAEDVDNSEWLLSPESISFGHNHRAYDDTPVEFDIMGSDSRGKRVDLCDLDDVPTYKLSKSSIRNTTSSSGSSLEGISAIHTAVEEPEAEDDDIQSRETFDSFGDLIDIRDDLDDVYETLDTKDMEAVKPSFQTDRQLWQQIADLRDAAENVYQYTKESTALHMTQGGSIRSPLIRASK